MFIAALPFRRNAPQSSRRNAGDWLSSPPGRGRGGSALSPDLVGAKDRDGEGVLIRGQSGQRCLSNVEPGSAVSTD